MIFLFPGIQNRIVPEREMTQAKPYLCHVKTDAVDKYIEYDHRNKGGGKAVQTYCEIPHFLQKGDCP